MGVKRQALTMSGFVLLAAAGGVRAQTSAAPGAGSADLKAVAWLAGCWRAGGGPFATEEQWMAPLGGLMVGMSRTVREGRARAWEFLLIRLVEGRLVYWAHPSGQDPTAFPAMSVGEGDAVFVNPEHDFPKRIEYRRASADWIVAAVYGDAEGGEPAFTLDYGRVPCPGAPR